jgi:catechol 2,3-dioxygenase-like lactoylglutathione lyase family enzyme
MIWVWALRKRTRAGRRHWLLLLSGPGAAHAMPDGTLPDPGGWNRIVIQVPDLAAAVDELRARGARFRHEIVTGVGVRQALLEDPSGNLVELFEPILPEARLSRPTPSSGQPGQ